jgi:hypothetical protein
MATAANASAASSDGAAQARSSDGEHAGPREHRRILLAACLILAAAAALRLARLDHFSYWLDEVLEARFVEGTWREFWAKLRFDAAHPPLDYLVVRGIDALGPPDWVRKIPAALWGVGTVAALGALVRRRAGPGAALLSAGLLALAPYHVRYSQELRPYSLGLFLMCLALAALDRFLGKPTLARLAAVFAAAVACAYALYLAAATLALAAAALVAEDCFARAPIRRRAARRFAWASPLFLAAASAAYWPWIPVLAGISRPRVSSSAEELSLERVDRLLSFFAFAPNDGYLLGPGGLFAVALMAGGAWIAVRRPGLRFLAVWALLGLTGIGLATDRRFEFFASRWFLPAGLALTALLGLALAELLGRGKAARIGGLAALAVVVVLEVRGLAAYYRIGRPDWRPLAAYLARESRGEERIFTENQYTQLCVGYYLQRSLPPGSGNPPLDVHGEVRPVAWSWPPGRRAWLVLGCGPRSPGLRAWAEPFPTVEFPTAEGGTVVKRLDADDWAGAMRRVR